MTPTFFEYPKSTAYGRVLHKNKIYLYADPGKVVKQYFVNQVDQIIWQHKLAPETLNLKASKNAPEIQIFSITLKEDKLHTEVLRCIDCAIPFPIIYELRYNGKIKTVAAWKRPNEVDSSKWVVSEYFDNHWTDADTPRKPLPIVYDLEALYVFFLTHLMSHPARPGEDLQTQVKRMELIRLKQRELERCQNKLRSEKQFNLKIPINAELRNLKHELECLIS